MATTSWQRNVVWRYSYTVPAAGDRTFRVEVQTATADSITVTRGGRVVQTLLQFEPAFRDAEERASRRRTAAEQLSIIRDTEPTFIESVTKTSLTLTSSLDDSFSEDEIVTTKAQAIVLEKLVQSADPEDELPEV